ncbi:hypothetical protein [Saccharibacillus sacchari]|uniref:Uncharacterized protein n=1 Tax=Saccharibacillus sacchari TaxID=456493 RepID=A0ACC6PKA5_9BACL
MNLNDKLISKHEFCGQALYILSPDYFQYLIEDPTIEGQQISAFDLVVPMMDFVKKHQNFSLACYSLGTSLWMFCLLLKKEGKLYKVQLENAECEVCKWTGQIANPTIPELYFGCRNRWDAMEEAYKAPFVPCPKCHSVLSRPTIWIDD